MAQPCRSLRPAMPPLLAFSLCLWAAVNVSFRVIGSLDFGQCLVLAVVTGAVSAAALLTLWIGIPRLAVACLCGLMVGTAVGAVQGARYLSDADAAADAPPSDYLFHIEEDGRAGSYGTANTASVVLDDGRRVMVRLMLPAGQERLLYGKDVHAQARFESVGDAARESYRTRGLVAVAKIQGPLSIDAPWTATFRDDALGLFEGYDGKGSAFLRAILFGDRGGLEDDGLYQAVKVAGLAHVVAVSGAHLSVVCLLFGSLLGALRLPRRMCAISQAGFIITYLFCTGMPVSGIRAAFMVCIAFAALFAKRRASGISALAVCICVMIIVDPMAALSVSFSLSALATLGILVLSPLFKEWFAHILGTRFAFVTDALALTASASISTALLSMALFSQASIVAPIANLLAAPTFVFFCAGGLVVVSLALLAPVWGAGLIGALVAAADAFCEGVMALSRIPYAAVPAFIDILPACALTAAAIGGLWVLWPKPTKRAAAIASTIAAVALMLTLTVAPKLHGDQIIMLDVGQGDAFVIRSEGKAVLVDTGNRDAALLKGLARHGVPTLEAVLITHADDDHCASLDALSGLVRTKSVGMAAGAFDCACAPCTDLVKRARALSGSDRVLGLNPGDTFSIGAFTIDVLWPAVFEDEGGNADSLVLRVAYKEGEGAEAIWTALLCGDAENDQLAALIESGRLGSCDILKVGHHGSKNAFDAAVLSEIGPEIALVSCGTGNRYGHPAKSITELLDQEGAETFRTDTMGDVVCEFSDTRITVRTLG